MGAGASTNSNQETVAGVSKNKSNANIIAMKNEVILK